MDQRQSLKFNPEILIKWVIFTCAITGIALVSAFYPVIANIPLIVLPGILVLLFAKPVFFEKIKMITLLAMRIIIIFAAAELFNPQFYVDVVMLMLIVNILEATFTDLLRHRKYFNAISGFALAIGVISLRGVWQYDAPFGNYYLADGAFWYVTLMYAIAYTLWNWIFVSNEFSASVALLHTGFLVSPLLGALCTIGMGKYGGTGLWLLLRANSLSCGGWMQIGAKNFFEREFYSPLFEKFVAVTKKKNVQIVCMAVNLLLIAFCIALTVKNGGVKFELSPFFAD